MPKAHNVLFLCTGNSARSILAEAILNKHGRGRFRGFSAGSHPRGRVHPAALELLIDLGHDTAFLRSKGMTVFTEAGAPPMDFIITVCDAAAGEACPLWPGRPAIAHWGIPDPVAGKAPAHVVRASLAHAYQQLERRITAFLELPIEDMTASSLRQALERIGEMEGATARTLQLA